MISHVANSHVNFTRVNSCGIFVRDFERKRDLCVFGAAMPATRLRVNQSFYRTLLDMMLTQLLASIGSIPARGRIVDEFFFNRSQLEF